MGRRIVNKDSESFNSALHSQPHESSTIQPSQPWDWTYSTTYNGSTDGGAQWKTVSNDCDIIPLDKLSDTSQPILFYDDVQLYEDELGDNGQVGLNVKIVGVQLQDEHCLLPHPSESCHSPGSSSSDSSSASTRCCSGCTMCAYITTSAKAQ